jgi:hypothetical protein
MIVLSNTFSYIYMVHEKYRVAASVVYISI